MYRGDEKIKNFIWDLISPNESGEANIISRNHSGLHNLVPRGRNAKGRMRILEYNNKIKPIKTNTYAIFFIFSLVNSNPIHVSIHFIYFAFHTLCASYSNQSAMLYHFISLILDIFGTCLSLNLSFLICFVSLSIAIFVFGFETILFKGVKAVKV